MSKVKKERTLKFRVKESGVTAIQELADIYANGNISAWLRKAALKYRPEKKP